MTLFKYIDTSKARYIKVHLLKKDYFFIHLKIIYQGVLIDFFDESDIHINKIFFLVYAVFDSRGFRIIIMIKSKIIRDKRSG